MKHYSRKPKTQFDTANRLLMTMLLLSIGVGAILSGYLFMMSITERLGMSSGGLCAMLGGGCEETLRSTLSSVFGVPLAAWGLVFYVVLSAHLITHRLSFGDERAPVTGIAFSLGFAAATVGILLLFVMMTGGTVFCPLCALIHVVNIILAFVLFRLTRSTLAEMLRRGWLTLKLFVAGTGKLTLASRLSITGFVLALVLGVALFEWAVIIEKDLDSRALHVDEHALLQSMQRQAVVNIPLYAEDPVLGDTSAALRVVVFSDFQCPACAILALEFMKLAPLFGSDVALIFKHFPLDKDCNPLLETDIHPHACSAARASEAARRQGKFWEFHDALYLGRMAEREMDFAQLAVSVGCDSLRFADDYSSPDVRAVLSRSIDLAARLQINGTPTVFINGRRVHDSRPRAVHVLIERMLFDLRRFREMFVQTDAPAVPVVGEPDSLSLVSR